MLFVSQRERHTVDDALAIGVGAESADAPDSGVAERAIVQVHRILRRDDHADAEGARLLHQRDDGSLGRWASGVRRQKAVDLVEYDGRLQLLRAGKSADPLQRANLFDRWLGEVVHQRREIGIVTGEQAALGEDGEQYMLTTLGRIGITTEQAEYERDSDAQRCTGRLRIGVPAV